MRLFLKTRPWALLPSSDLSSFLSMWSGPLLSTWPHHPSLPSVILSTVLADFFNALISSFLLRSARVTPTNHLSIRISATFVISSSFLLGAQYFTEYSMELSDISPVMFSDMATTTTVWPGLTSWFVWIVFQLGDCPTRLTQKPARFPASFSAFVPLGLCQTSSSKINAVIHKLWSSDCY